MTSFSQLSTPDAPVDPGRFQRESDARLQAVLEQHGFHLWQPGDPVSPAKVRLLIGVATYSSRDMALLDELASILASVGPETLHIDVFNIRSVKSAAGFGDYIAGLSAPHQTPVIGIWRSGKLVESASGSQAISCAQSWALRATEHPAHTIVELAFAAPPVPCSPGNAVNISESEASTAARRVVEHVRWLLESWPSKTHFPLPHKLDPKSVALVKSSAASDARLKEGSPLEDMGCLVFICLHRGHLNARLVRELCSVSTHVLLEEKIPFRLPDHLLHGQSTFTDLWVGHLKFPDIRNTEYVSQRLAQGINEGIERFTSSIDAPIDDPADF